MFGSPEFTVEVRDGKVVDVNVQRGAPCGATSESARRIVGLPVDEAITRIGLETQFFCFADPSSWDPLWGKSPVHFAGNVHAAALKRAVKSLKK